MRPEEKLFSEGKISEETRDEMRVENFLDERLFPVLKGVPAVILYKGAQVKLPSGKTAWKNKGAARIALTQALEFNYYDDKDLRTKYSLASNLRKEMEERGIIEIKEFKG